MSQVNYVTEETFDSEVLSSDKPVLVVFFTQWATSRKSKAFFVIVDEVTPKYADTLKIARCDLDAFPQVAKSYDICGEPTLVLFKNGSSTATLNYASQSMLTEMLNAHL
ncbi:thioredoxin family protein [Pandoraea sp. NPDC087047]|uniref:thioredoxin family protein n=1 Tax=Pandoraea sp. NPDC087047 TaxID=3364390 RepID=UPI003804336A